VNIGDKLGDLLAFLYTATTIRVIKL